MEAAVQDDVQRHLRAVADDLAHTLSDKLLNEYKKRKLVKDWYFIIKNNQSFIINKSLILCNISNRYLFLCG